MRRKTGRITDLEDIKESTGVETGLLVDSGEKGILLATLGEQ